MRRMSQPQAPRGRMGLAQGKCGRDRDTGTGTVPTPGPHGVLLPGCWSHPGSQLAAPASTSFLRTMRRGCDNVSSWTLIQLTRLYNNGTNDNDNDSGNARDNHTNQADLFSCGKTHGAWSQLLLLQSGMAMRACMPARPHGHAFTMHLLHLFMSVGSHRAAPEQCRHISGWQAASGKPRPDCASLNWRRHLHLTEGSKGRRGEDIYAQLLSFRFGRFRTCVRVVLTFATVPHATPPASPRRLLHFPSAALMCSLSQGIGGAVGTAAVAGVRLLQIRSLTPTPGARPAWQGRTSLTNSVPRTRARHANFVARARARAPRTPAPAPVRSTRCRAATARTPAHGRDEGAVSSGGYLALAGG
eukprot:180105-Chlamydomonas_euryale.AAC.3